MDIGGRFYFIIVLVLISDWPTTFTGMGGETSDPSWLWEMLDVSRLAVVVAKNVAGSTEVSGSASRDFWQCASLGEVELVAS